MTDQTMDAIFEEFKRPTLIKIISPAGGELGTNLVAFDRFRVNLARNKVEFDYTSFITNGIAMQCPGSSKEFFDLASETAKLSRFGMTKIRMTTNDYLGDEYTRLGLDFEHHQALFIERGQKYSNLDISLIPYEDKKDFLIAYCGSGQNLSDVHMIFKPIANQKMLQFAPDPDCPHRAGLKLMYFDTKGNITLPISERTWGDAHNLGNIHNIADMRTFYLEHGTEEASEERTV